MLDALARGAHAFTDHIAVSPTVGVWPDGLAAALRRRFRPMSATTPGPGSAGSFSAGELPGQGGNRVSSLFIVYGERDGPLVTEYTPALVGAVRDVLPSGLRLRTEVLPGQGHAPPASLERGLRFVFEPLLPATR